MTHQVRRVAIACFVLFGALFVNLNVVQVLQADALSNDNRNARQLYREYEIHRGSIVAADGATELARAEETPGQLRYVRRYPASERYAHLTGYYSLVYGRSEVEQSFNDFLSGTAPEAFARNIADLLAGRERTGDDVFLTVDPRTQDAAFEALGDNRGAVVALDPRSGDVLAMVSKPTFDPERLSSHDTSDIRAYWTELNEDPHRPLRNRVTREWYPPGSTFKLVTAAAALESGVADTTTMFDDPRVAELPQTTASIPNFGGGLCNNGQPLDLAHAMRVSCNTTFAQLGLDLGAERLVEMARRFGFDSPPEIDVASPLISRIPDADTLDPPSTAQSAIGQRDVRVTPLQMAQITAAIGNGGVLMKPRLVRQVEDERRQILAEYAAQPWVPAETGSSQAVSADTARILSDMMVGVVEDGTGTRAQIDGVRVAGKTGTAQTGGDGPPQVWFVGFAPAEEPTVAVAVVIEDGGDVGDEATGGAIAAPIARAVMEAALARSAQAGGP